MTSRLKAILISSTLFIATHAYAEAPNVTVSIKPLHSIVANIMDGIGKPALIVDGAASPHSFNLRPSNAKDLQSADIVFWLGNGFETFLEKPLETLSSKATTIKLSDAPNLTRLPMREGGAFEEHDHSHGGAEDDNNHAHDHHSEHEHADDNETDLHLWLDPKNAVAISRYIADILSAHDEANAPTYQKNAATYIEQIEKTNAAIKVQLAEVKDQPFIVFHDAYQYFEHAYDLQAAGSITVSPETPPGAERIGELQQKVKDANVSCIFAEPQFEPKVIKIISEGIDVKTETLDPEATTLSAGKGLYLELIQNLASSFTKCLSK